MESACAKSSRREPFRLGASVNVVESELDQLRYLDADENGGAGLFDLHAALCFHEQTLAKRCRRS